MSQRMPLEQVEGMVKQLEADYKGTTVQFMNKYIFVASTPAAVKEKLTAQAVTAPPEIAIALIRATSNYDPRVALSSIKVPIRAINSDLSPTDLEGNRKVASDFDAVIIKGVGHFPMMEDPKRFNESLTGVLRDLRK